MFCIRASTCLPLVMALITGGCASGYAQFYQPTDGMTQEVVERIRVASPPATPLIEHASCCDRDGDMQALVDRYIRRGYEIIGFSSFNSSVPPENEGAIAQGKGVGADRVVIFRPRYTNSSTSAVPLVLPVTSTTVIAGTPGPIVATTTATQTTIIPVTKRMYDYGAWYLVKRKYELGVQFRDVTTEERQALQTNKGCGVRLVVDDTPAFHADILDNDIVVGVNGQQVASCNHFSEILQGASDVNVELSIFRGGKFLLKNFELGSD